MTDAENVPPFSFYGGARQSVAFEGGSDDMALGLPRQFVKSMKTLFDMMDDGGVGQVPLSEIERRWKEDAVPNLPGVLNALRMVAPPRGTLTFENFVSGLRLALHRSRNSNALKATNNLSASSGFRYGLPAHHSSEFSKATSVGKLPSFSNSHDSPWLLTEPAIFSEHVPRRDPSSDLQDEKSGRPFRHRRSNSGPIYTAKVLPHVKDRPHLVGLYTHDDMNLDALRLANHHYPPHFEGFEQPGREQRNLYSSRATSYSPATVKTGSLQRFRRNERLHNQTPSSKTIGTNVRDSPAPSAKTSVLDQMTASTLLVDQKKQESTAPVITVQPVVVSGKYIGITGTLKRNKSSNYVPERRNGSFHRPSMKKTTMVSSPMNSLSRNQSSATNTNGKKSWEGNGKSPEIRMPNLEESPGVTFRKRAVKKRDFIKGLPLAHDILQSEEGASSRCHNDSPSEVPAEKSAKSSGCDDKFRALSATSPVSSGSSSNGSPRYTDSGSACRRRRTNSASGAQRLRNARWNTAVIAFDSPTMRFLKELQQKEDLLKKGLNAVDDIKKSFQSGMEKVKSDRDELNARVENYSHALPQTKDLDSFQSPGKIFGGVLTSAVATLGTVLREFQKLEESTQLDMNAEKGSSELKERNVELNKKVSEQSDEIAQLGKEKVALVRQLFEARSELQQKSGFQPNTSIFI